jgi:hypothetical protein
MLADAETGAAVGSLLGLVISVVLVYYLGRYLVTRGSTLWRVVGYALAALYWPVLIVLIIKFYGMEPGAKRWTKLQNGAQ